MKYMGMPMGMWALFGKSFEKHLIAELCFDADTAKSISVEAKLRYKQIVAGLPEFERGDRFKMNIVSCALLAAFVLSMPERPNVERLTKMRNDRLSNSSRAAFPDFQVPYLRVPRPAFGLPAHRLLLFFPDVPSHD